MQNHIIEENIGLNTQFSLPLLTHSSIYDMY
jgi:hypothetical protein